MELLSKRKRLKKGGFVCGGKNQQYSVDFFFKMAVDHLYGDARLVVECMSIYKSKLVYQLMLCNKPLQKSAT